MERTYKLDKRITSNFLINKGFKENRRFSDENSIAFIYNWNIYNFFECELLIYLPERKMLINVYDQDTKSVYVSWYNRDFGKSKIVKQIDANIKSKLLELKLIRKETVL